MRIRAINWAQLVHLLILLAGLLSCAPTSFQANVNKNRSPASTFDSLKSCSFADTNTLRNVIEQKLGIAKKDVPLVDAKGNIKTAAECKQGSSTQCFYLHKFRADLGEASPNEGRLANTECTPTKFRITTEMFINACAMAMSQPAIKETLFPKGVEEFEYLYLSFVGRRPEGNESMVLSELQNQFDSKEKKAIAACASVAASLESLTIM